MAILVIFGIPDNFGVAHGKWVQGNNGDCLYFADDKSYAPNDRLLGLPGVTTNTLLPVIQHKSGGVNHSSQIAWLSREVNYEPLRVDDFSHVGEPFSTIRRLLADASSSLDDVSKFVEPYGKRMVLQLIDNLAAWNTLCKVSNDDGYKSERRKLINKVNKFLVNCNLNNPDITCLSHEDALKILEEQAAKFC
jgi:hypothetical protein